MVNYLKNWMEFYEIEPESLACEIGISEKSIKSFLEKKKAPLKDLFSLAYYLGTDTETLLYSDGYEHQFLKDANSLDLINKKYDTDCNGMVGYTCVTLMGYKEKFHFPVTKDIVNVKGDLRDGYDYVVFPTLSDRIIVLNMKFVKNIEFIQDPDYHPLAKGLHSTFISTPFQPLFYEIATFESSNLVEAPEGHEAENLPKEIRDDYCARLMEIKESSPVECFTYSLQKMKEKFADYVSKTVFYFSDGEVEEKSVDYSTPNDLDRVVLYTKEEDDALFEYNTEDRTVFTNFFDACCMIEIPLRIFEYYERHPVF